MTMTRESLESYRSKKAEIAELHNTLLHLGAGDTMFGNDTILDYRSGYPVPNAVVGVDWDKVFRIESRYKKKLSVLEEECQEVEDFVESISDSLTRRIFRMYYVEGLSQQEIARNVHMDRSRISRKIDEFIKNAHKAQKAQL